MANWEFKIDVSEEWKQTPKGSDEDSRKLAKVFIKKLEPIKETMFIQYPHYHNEIEEIIWDFESVYDVEDFDNALERLYDFGDISLDDKWPTTKMLWVGTF